MTDINTHGFSADGTSIPGTSQAELEDAFSRAFGTEPGAPDPTVTIPAEGQPTDGSAPDATAPDPREGGEGGAGPSPAGSPDPNIPAAEPDAGGATEFTPPPDAPAPTDPAEPRYVVGDDTGQPVPSGATDTTPPAPDNSVDVNRLLEGYMGRPPTLDDGRALMELVDFSATLQQLPPDAQAAIAHIVQTGKLPDGPPAPAAPAAAPVVSPADPWDDSTPAPAAPVVDPALQARLDAIEQQQAQAEQIRQQQVQQWVGQEQSAGLNEFMGELPSGVALRNEDLILLEQRAMRSGIFAQEMQRSGGSNPRAAWKASLHATLNSDPAFAQRVVDARAQAIVAQQSADLERQRRAASVSAGGGSVPTPQQVERPANFDDAAARIAADVRALEAGGASN